MAMHRGFKGVVTLAAHFTTQKWLGRFARLTCFTGHFVLLNGNPFVFATQTKTAMLPADAGSNTIVHFRNTPLGQIKENVRQFKPSCPLSVFSN